MKHINHRTIGLFLLASCLFLSSTAYSGENFKILRTKGTVTIGDKTVKPGQEFELADIENLTVSTPDESGLVIVCYNNCAKNKVILEKTIDNLDAVQKRKLLEITAFKTRGKSLESFPELVTYFEQKPFLILGESKLAVTQSVLGFPKTGSFLDLYYLHNNEEVIHEIPYNENSFLFKYNMFVCNGIEEGIVGPIALTMIDPNGSRENLITEDFYVGLIDVSDIENNIKEMLALEVDKDIITEAIYDMLISQYPNYYVDKEFVQQFVMGK